MDTNPPLAATGSGRAGDAYFREFVRVAPIAHAISRAIEARHLGTVEQKQPMLDIGCGYGEFGRALYRVPCDVGIDIRDFDLRVRLPGVYRHVILCDAHRLPLAPESFQTVFSVSVLEHIPDVEPVLAEAVRVLRPGGVFALTVPLAKLGSMWAVPRAMRAIGMEGVGKLYADRLNATFSHINLWTPERWAEALKALGMEVEVCREIVSPRATAIYDMWLPTALSSQVLRLLTKKRFIYRPPGMVDFLTRRFAKLVNEDEAEGSNLFLVARKP
jgi:SAM-dependent methyltransferase